MAKASPTQRSLEMLRKQGWLVAVVERWNPHARIRQDLFGFGDLLAVSADQKLFLIVQTTSATNFSARRTKVLSNESAHEWLRAGGLVAVHGWQKKGNGRWFCREEILDVTSID